MMSSFTSSPPELRQASNHASPSASPSSPREPSDASFLLSQLPGESLSFSASDEKHPKSRRKRTAAKDKTILEASYRANPKPDKAARLEIVDRVSLNEKEVQIWFQNRRQNDRRKSRPLSPQELVALRCGGMQILSSEPILFSSPLPESVGSPTVAATQPDSISTRTEALSANVSPGFSCTQMTPTKDPQEGRLATIGTEEGKAVNIGPEIRPQRVLESDLSAVSSPAPQSIARLPDQYSHDGAEGKLATIDGRLKSSECSESTASVPAHTKSLIRFSLSLDGKAEVVTNDTSPPRPSSTSSVLSCSRPRVLQRSHSAMPTVTLPPISTLTSYLPSRIPRGRSKDVHAWELCCDAEAQDELTTQAKNESNGSAVAAISLLRSSSAILPPCGSKRVAPSQRSSQRSQQFKKAKLWRSSSSVGILQSTSNCNEQKQSVGVAACEPASGKVMVSMLVSPSGDSDKENWCPPGHGRPSRRGFPAEPRGRNPRRSGRPLQDHLGPDQLASKRANTAPDLGGAEIGFDSGLDKSVSLGDDEVRSFMRGEVSPSKKGDVDCVAGLLALAQGNWR